MYNEAIVPMKTESFSGVAAKSPISQCIKSVVRRACVEKRLTVGLEPAIQRLASGRDALFCLTAPPPPGDSARHMQLVLLHAYCGESGISTIKVDSASKMGKLLGFSHPGLDFSCVLVHSPYADPFTDSQEPDLNILSESERALIDYCDSDWGCIQAPVVKLPEK